MSNSILTEVLRDSVGAEGVRVDAPVTYRDGSQGPPFPLRAIHFCDLPSARGRVLRLSLISIRHIEMDSCLDGAFLRNTDISRPRPAGETDEMTFAISRRQLAELCALGPTTLYLHQTGLEPAIMGFYRAVTLQLIETPGLLAVIPMYYQRPALDGTPAAGFSPQASFCEGRPWTA